MSSGSLRSPRDITAVILCGGEGRRMGGADKPLVLFRGRPLIEHLLEGIANAVGDFVLVANRSLDRYGQLRARVISDTRLGLGPLGGIASAATHVHTPWAFVCAGDMPFLRADLVDRLAAFDTSAADTKTAAPILRPRVAHDGERRQPLVALVPAGTLPVACERLDHASPSVHGWLDAIGAIDVPLPAFADAMQSLDTPDLLRALEFNDARHEHA